MHLLPMCHRKLTQEAAPSFLERRWLGQRLPKLLSSGLPIPAFSRNPIKKIAGKEKGYFSDTGFLSYLQRISSSEAIGSHPLKGSLFETYIAMEMLKVFHSWPLKPNLYHFRSYSGAEVDLVVELNGRLFPIEIKAKSNPTRKDTKGFASFRACFPHEQIQQGLVICSIAKTATTFRRRSSHPLVDYLTGR